MLELLLWTLGPIFAAVVMQMVFVDPIRRRKQKRLDAEEDIINARIYAKLAADRGNG
jgi:cytochrome c-type biogenesis protein CcmH/NrfF